MSEERNVEREFADAAERYRDDLAAASAAEIRRIIADMPARIEGLDADGVRRVVSSELARLANRMGDIPIPSLSE